MIYPLKYLLCIFIVLGSCAQSESNNSEMVSINATVEKIINAYIQSIPINNRDSIITVSIHTKNDSVILSIANSYPDLNIAKFQALKLVDKYAICFVGDKNENFYTVTGKQKIPKAISEKSKKLYEIDNRPPSGDPLHWLFYFRGDSIIGMYPKEEIDKFIFNRDIQSNK